MNTFAYFEPASLNTIVQTDNVYDIIESNNLYL